MSVVDELKQFLVSLARLMTGESELPVRVEARIWSNPRIGETEIRLDITVPRKWGGPLIGQGGSTADAVRHLTRQRAAVLGETRAVDVGVHSARKRAPRQPEVTRRRR